MSLLCETLNHKLSVGETHLGGGFVSNKRREVLKLDETFNFEINASLPHFTL